MQVGALDPDAGRGLRTTLLIAHPHEDVVHKQGSHLSREKMGELEDMQKHEDLLDMQTLIKERIMQLIQVRPHSVQFALESYYFTVLFCQAGS